MGGLAVGPFGNVSFSGPAVRAYLRGPLAGSPLAVRLDVEVSQTNADYSVSGFPLTQKSTDVRGLLGAEFGLPVAVGEVFVVGSAGLSRRTDETTQGPIRFTSGGDLRFAHDVGLGFKFGKLFLGEFHFFSSDGAPYRLLAGVRF